MERLLHYIWKHKMFPLKPLTTTDGLPLEIIDPGLMNPNSGPDFFNAKVKIDGTMWVGNIEIHDKSSDWNQHGHNKDTAYDNVVLHVTGNNDMDVRTSDGKFIPQMVLSVPESVRLNYTELLHADSFPPCYKIIPELSTLTIHSWLSRLQTERLEQKTKAIEKRVELCGGSWEDALFVTMARNYGFGVNGEAFEAWALNVPLQSIAHHRDDLFQIEAFFMGQAGLLDVETIPEYHRDEAMKEGYFMRLRNEYIYLSRKFALHPMDASLWRFLRLRPQNFPHIRISQLANLYHSRQSDLSKLVESKDIEQLKALLRTKVTPYWETHYSFGGTTTRTDKILSDASLNLLLINTVIPMLFAYGRHRSDERLCERAFAMLEQLKAENNYIIRIWQQCGLVVRTAGDSQALIQLKREYCDKKDCLRCRIGYEYLKKQVK
ncbi:MAG: DUF2851 family protein [Prevotellaceae bacterium]|nr:DUF2851 family protein [Prevotellaceae bacterium]